MTAAAAATPAELAHLIARGDRKRAASLLVRDHAPAVLALCCAMVRDPRLAEDLSQDAFARAFGALDGFRGEASPRTWLLKIARNRCLDHLDRARRAPWAGAGAAADPEPDDHAADAPPPHDLLARREDAERAMAVLGEGERALVVLHFGHGVGYPELADSFGLREGTVRMRISRALARMREALAAALARSLDDFELEAPTPAVPERAAAAAGGPRLEARASRRSLAEIDEDDDRTEALEGATALDDTALALAMEDTGVAMAMPMDDTDLAMTMLSELDPGLDPATDPAAAPPPTTTFSSIREDVPPALRGRLEALAAAL